MGQSELVFKMVTSTSTALSFPVPGTGACLVPSFNGTGGRLTQNTPTMARLPYGVANGLLQLSQWCLSWEERLYLQCDRPGHPPQMNSFPRESQVTDSPGGRRAAWGGGTVAGPGCGCAEGGMESGEKSTRDLGSPDTVAPSYV